MKIEIKSAVSHITASGITVDITVSVDDVLSALTIQSRSNGCREWRYLVTLEGNQYRLDTDDFLKQEHKMWFDHNDVFDVSYVAHMVKHLGTDISEKASEKRWDSEIKNHVVKSYTLGDVKTVSTNGL